MQRPNADLLKRIDNLSPAELAAIDDRARELGVGGSRWEEAWVAAGYGHWAAIPAYSRAVSAGATPVAAAAIAGAVAAQQTEALITQDQYETLVQPVVEAIAPGRHAIEAVASVSARRAGATSKARYRIPAIHWPTLPTSLPCRRWSIYARQRS